jgi:hypothetical protein
MNELMGQARDLAECVNWRHGRCRNSKRKAKAEPDRIDVPRGWLYRVLIPNKKVSEARSVSLSPVHSHTIQILCLARSLPTTTSFTNLLVKHRHQHLLLSM